MEQIIIKRGKNRDLTIDLCRVLGSFSIIIAHVNSPIWLNHIRCFDVILLTMISGYCISSESFFKYLYKRTKRLVFPTWLLLTILFTITSTCCFIVGRPQLYSTVQIIRAFSFLNNSIGYVWIVRVYIGIAFLSPVIIGIVHKIKSNWAILAIVFLLLCMNTIMIWLHLDEMHEAVYYIIETLVYGMTALIGYRIRMIQGKKEYRQFITVIIIGCTIVSVIFSIPHFEPNSYKYPPQVYYFCYGLLVSILVFCLFRRFFLVKKPNRKFANIVTYISKISFDIYLLHILVLSAVNFVEDYANINLFWSIKYIFVITLSTLGAVIVDIIRLRVLKRILIKQ